MKGHIHEAWIIGHYFQALISRPLKLCLKLRDDQSCLHITNWQDTDQLAYLPFTTPLTTPALKQQKTEVDYLVFLAGLKAAVEFILHSSLWKVKNPENPRVFWQRIPLVFELDFIF